MGTTAVLKARGLHVSDNELSVPDGALVQADNVVIRYRDTIEPRPGQNTLATIGGGTERARAGTFFKRAGMATTDRNLVIQSATDVLYYWSGSAFSAYAGTFASPSNYRIKFAGSDNSLFFTTSAGAKFIESPGATPVDAGIPQALDGRIAAQGNAGTSFSGVWLQANTQIAYRVVFGRVLANKRVILGPPSGRCVLVQPADITVAAGSLVRTGGSTVTATVAAGHGRRVGDQVVFNAAVPDAAFPNGQVTVSAVTTTTIVFGWAGANAASTVAYTMSAGPALVNIAAYLPVGVLVGDFVRVYRSFTSANAATPPDDEMYLVYETTITSSHVSSGQFTAQDSVSEAAMQGLYSGYPLYTNANTGDGSGAANFQPTTAHDVAEWQRRVWYGRTKSKSRFRVTLLGVPPEGWTITLNPGGVYFAATYTAKAVPSLSSDFRRGLYSTSIATNVRDTVQALVEQINAQARQTGGGYPIRAIIDDSTSTPGSFILEGVGASTTFTVTSSDGSYTSPNLPTSGTTGASTNDDWGNGLYYSKVDQPESVPLLNYLRVGPSNCEILRIVPLRERLYVFTTVGIYIVSGTSSFNVDLLDDTAIVTAPDSVCVLNGRIYALTTQGVVQVSEAGVGILSRPIERALQDVLGNTNTAIRAFAVAREKQREYVLFCPDATSTGNVQAYIYNYITQTWVRWIIDRSAAVVDPWGGLYSGDADTNTVFVEDTTATGDRPTTAITGAIASVTPNADGTYELYMTATQTPVAGDLIYAVGGASGVVQSVVVDVALYVTVALRSGSTVFGTDSVVFLKPFQVDVRWAPFVGGEPAIEKEFSEVALHFRTINTLRGAAAFSTEISPTEETRTFALSGLRKNRRLGVPQEKARATGLVVGFSLLEAGDKWALNGYSVTADGTSERSTN